MPPKRILMTSDTVGGVWTYSLDLASRLAGYSIEVYLATMGPLPSQFQKRQLERLSNVHLHESNYRLEWMENPWDDVDRAGNWLLGLEKQFKPDIVHLNGYAHGVLPWAAPTCMVAHSCVLSWWEAVRGESAPAEWTRYRKAVTAGIRNAHYLVAPTRAMLEALGRYYPMLPARSVIYNGSSPNLYSPGQKRPLIFAAGRLWDAAKNLEMVIKCASELPWQLVIAGDGASKFPERDNLLLLGKISPQEVAEYMAIASIYCFPARYEPFGPSVLEAALSGCALVLGNIPSLRELWSSAAVFVDPDDQSALVRALSQLIENSNTRIELARSALDRAKKFNLQRMTNGYLKVYERLHQSTRKRVEYSRAQR
jgi:glycogen(starch) synthase